MNFNQKMQKFMYGRYGPDDLYGFLLKLYFVLILINIFIKSSILSILELLIFILMFYRVFSKKIYNRSKENQMYLKLKEKVLKPFINIKRNIKDKDHVYKKCHNCKTTMKLPLPYRKGFKIAKCPKCGKKRRVLVLKSTKIEIIREKK